MVQKTKYIFPSATDHLPRLLNIVAESHCLSENICAANTPLFCQISKLKGENSYTEGLNATREQNNEKPYLRKNTLWNKRLPYTNMSHTEKVSF